MSGETAYLPGDDELLQRNLRDRIVQLLSRRGYQAEDDNPEYVFQVDFASCVRTAVAFEHSIAIEVLADSETPVWKAESMWQSEDADILERIDSVLSGLVAELPKETPAAAVPVPMVRSSHAFNYYYVACCGKTFACPALPARILFPGVSRASDGTIIASLPSEIRNTHALAAYVDLVDNAEEALPLGRGSWQFPPDSLLWTEAMIGGEYLLGERKERARVLVRLFGEDRGYVVRGCWLASEKEYEEYRTRLADWRKAVNEFMSFFAKSTEGLPQTLHQ